MNPLCFLALSLAAVNAPPGEPLWAGAARVDITPPTGYPMWGYAARHDKPSEGVLEPLQARALVLRYGKDKIALVSLDLGRAPTRASTAAIRQRVRQAAGIEHLFLTASHTHHGPVLELDGWPTPQTSYVRQLEGKIGDAILAADRALRTAFLGVVSKEVPLNRNRHSRLPDRPVDRQLLVLRVVDMGDRPIAHLVNFAAHPTLLPAQDRRFSPDYPGEMAALVEKETGAPCLFLQGAAGDLSPEAGQEATPAAFGRTLADAVLKMIPGIICWAIPLNLQVQEDDFKFPCRADLGNPLIQEALGRAFFPDLVAFYEREYREGVRPHLTTALLGERIGIVGVSGEFFCGHALSLRRRARLEHLLFLGYCNDYHQYFPTIEAAAEGGYGTSWATSPAEIGAGERIMDRALLRLYQMRGKLADLPAPKPMGESKP